MFPINRHFTWNNVMCEQPAQRSAHFWYRNNFCRRAILDFATLRPERATDERTQHGRTNTSDLHGATLGPKDTRPQSTKTAVCAPVSPRKFQTAHQFLAW